MSDPIEFLFRVRRQTLLVVTAVSLLGGIAAIATNELVMIPKSHRNAVAQARTYVAQFHPTWHRPEVSCQLPAHADMISCTVGAAGVDPEPLECTEYVWFAGTANCRLARSLRTNRTER